jgi:hypothetical protein
MTSFSSIDFRTKARPAWSPVEAPSARGLRKLRGLGRNLNTEPQNDQFSSNC